MKLCCLCRSESAAKLGRVILEHTTSQGVRLKEYDRLRLNWRLEEVTTSLGTIRVKTTELDGATLRRVLEYEDVKALAEKHGKPMHEIRTQLLREI